MERETVLESHPPIRSFLRRGPLASALLALALTLGGALTPGSPMGGPSVARAQDTPNQVEAGAKGTIGLGLVGAELGFVLPTAFGLRETWSIILFPVIGATGGALAGYFLIDRNDETEWAVASLALGLALVIPATVLTVKFTSYDPGDVAPPPPPPAEGEAAARPPARAAAPPRVADLVARSGLVRLADGALALGLPALSVRANVGLREAALFGLTPEPELHVPVVTGAF